MQNKCYRHQSEQISASYVIYILWYRYHLVFSPPAIPATYSYLIILHIMHNGNMLCAK